jgi:hypothetical protein
MTISDRLTVVVTLSVAVVVGLSYLSDRSQPSAPIPTKIQIGLDSLSRTRPAFDSGLIQSQRERERSASAQRASLKREAIARARADAAQRNADSLAVLAAAIDSTSSEWRTAYEARTVEASELRTSLSEGLAFDLRAVRQRNVAVEVLNESLVLELRKQPKPCRATCKVTWLAAGMVLDKAVQLAVRE